MQLLASNKAFSSQYSRLENMMYFCVAAVVERWDNEKRDWFSGCEASSLQLAALRSYIRDRRTSVVRTCTYIRMTGRSSRTKRSRRDMVLSRDTRPATAQTRVSARPRSDHHVAVFRSVRSTYYTCKVSSILEDSLLANKVTSILFVPLCTPYYYGF